jgi:leucyl aminopeptidase
MLLKISARTANAVETSADVAVIGVWSLSPSKKGRPAELAALERALGAGLARAMNKEDFRGKREQVLNIATFGRVHAAKVVIIGLGEQKDFKDVDARAFAAKAARTANAEKAKTLVLGVPEGLEGRYRYLAEGLELGAYRFTKYLTGDRKPKAELARVTITSHDKPPKTVTEQIRVGQIVAAGVNLSRDLSNEPPNVLTPAALATAAADVGKAHDVKVTILDYKEIVKRGMLLIQAVGQGSHNEPRFIHLAWVPEKKGVKRLVFVGKGVTFDSGGLSIKPAQGMGDMKHDMSGAGNMVGLGQIVGELKPNVEVHCICACVENMPGGGAYRPGDVWGSLDGKQVEIVNTDAEGRLILADALAYARDLKPDLLVDNATLTGACVVALGTMCSGWYANNEETANEFSAALNRSGEQMWRMPLLEDLRDQLKSDVADVKHTGDRWGGSISAALFLREFIGETKNWVHVDIAGPASSERAMGWNPKGATGHGVLTFLELVDAAAKVAPSDAPAPPPSPAPSTPEADAAPAVAKPAREVMVPTKAKSSRRDQGKTSPLNVEKTKAPAKPAPQVEVTKGAGTRPAKRAKARATKPRA